MSGGGKECSHHKGKQKKKIQRFCGGLFIFIFIVLLTFLIIWAVLQPRKPRFVLQEATVFNFNVSAPNLLSSNFQVTVAAHNPNDRVGIFYDTLNAYAVYQSQQITYYTAIPPVYQGHKDNNVWSPFIYGVNVPIAPYNGAALTRDQADGMIILLIKLDGKVRWKVGAFTTGRYHIHVRCEATMNFGNRASDGVFVSSAMKYQIFQSCKVSV